MLLESSHLRFFHKWSPSQTHLWNDELKAAMFVMLQITPQPDSRAAFRVFSAVNESIPAVLQPLSPKFPVP